MFFMEEGKHTHPALACVAVDYTGNIRFVSADVYIRVSHPVLKIYFGPPTAESKILKNHVNFDVGDLFF